MHHGEVDGQEEPSISHTQAMTADDVIQASLDDLVEKTLGQAASVEDAIDVQQRLDDLGARIERNAVNIIKTMKNRENAHIFQLLRLCNQRMTNLSEKVLFYMRRQDRFEGNVISLEGSVAYNNSRLMDRVHVATYDEAMIEVYADMRWTQIQLNHLTEQVSGNIMSNFNNQ